jgi:hypothetical protein
MIPPAGLAIAAITVMLWILWSDTIRTRPGSPILYALRVALYIIVSAILVLNRIRYPYLFSTVATALVVLAVVVGVFGAVHFARRLIGRRNE